MFMCAEGVPASIAQTYTRGRGGDMWASRAKAMDVL